MHDLSGFNRELVADIKSDADAQGLLRVEVFFNKMGEILAEAGELDTADLCYFEGRWKGRVLQVNGYGGDPRDADGVLNLLICDFRLDDEPQRLNAEDVKRLFRRLIEFLQASQQHEFRDSIEETSLGFGLADLISATWTSITKIKLILLSNREKRARGDAEPAGLIGEIPMTCSIWDLARIQRYVASGQVREELVIDFERDFGKSIPALHVSSDSRSYDNYIAVVPGTQLADIYDKWGARLLEANVRSFLQSRGKINRGIRDTIKDTPGMFFAYNNGITATAEAVLTRDTDAGLVVATAQNLQIVNGGQTTASIHAAKRLAPNQLKDVFVQMKLTIVPPEQSEKVVPKISQFANSQNKVNAADFFSNHPFHIRMEQFSRKILAPRKEDQYRETKWFYERARGQYSDTRAKFTAKERKKFDFDYPRSQYFTKTDLAKFEFSFRGHPHIVSCGAQKNFVAFAKEIGEEWTKCDAQFDETWYRRLISKAVLFRLLEKLVSLQDWYGGYRANIVTYGIAKVAYDAREKDCEVDLDAVWRLQGASPELKEVLIKAAAAANSVITNSPADVQNKSEWAKKPICWATLQKQVIDYGNYFLCCLTDVQPVKSLPRENS